MEAPIHRLWRLTIAGRRVLGDPFLRTAFFVSQFPLGEGIYPINMNPKGTLPLPPELEEKLAHYRRQVWIVKLAEGAFAALFGLAVSYLLVLGLDRVMETPGWLRGLLLTAGVAGFGIGLPLKWHRWVWRQRRLEDAARLLRRRFPRLGDQLLGIVELSHCEAGVGEGRSEALVRAAMAQAAKSVEGRDFSDAVPAARHRRWGWIAAAGCGVILLAGLLVPPAARNAMVRWVAPWRDVDRFTFARIEPVPRRWVVPFAEPIDLTAQLQKDTDWSPSGGTARLSGQPKVTADLEKGGYEFALPPQKSEALLKLSIGDVRERVEVIPTRRPELKTLQARLRLPEYLQYQTEPEIEARGGSITVLRGAEAAFTLTASRPLSKATMDGIDQRVEGDQVRTGAVAVQEDGERVFLWEDADGLSAREPLRLKVRAVDDSAPEVVARREALEQVVLETEVVSFDLEVRDDFGIKRAGLEWTGADPSLPPGQQVHGDKVAAAGGPEQKTITERATFSAAREGVAPQSLEVRAWAEDYRPGAPRSYSPAFLLYVLNKDEHAIWLTEQFGRWLAAAKETYEHEQRLHAANEELHALRADELDRPEIRRRIAQQAAAENANAARLASLNDNGRRLVEQATRNDAFDAGRLENWAGMLKTLKEIADQRMPSVADLLKASANAKLAGNQASTAQGNPPGDTKSGVPGESSKPPGEAQPPGGKSSSAPQVSQGPQPLPGGPPKPMDPNAPPKEAMPSVSDREAGFYAQTKPEEDPNAAPKKPSGGMLTLPTTTLSGGPPPSKKPGGDEGQSPAGDQMTQALYEQRDLLERFAKVTDQLQELLASLEASTFVKRLKAASRKQIAMAADMNKETLGGFGLPKKAVTGPVAARSSDVASRAKVESESVRVIQSDLEAYYQRKQDARFKNVLDQMKKVEIVSALAKVGTEADINLSGRTISGAEFWGDTLDRWAEEMVAAAEASNCKGGANGDALPPETVLKVMQVLYDEMKLRDETRELENSRPALEAGSHKVKARILASTQADLAEKIRDAAGDVVNLPDGVKRFEKELKLLSAVVTVMDEAESILGKPDTGAPAVAAESEIIELLLQARRQNPGGGGGGGSNPGGGGGAATAAMAALNEIGPGVDPSASVQNRNVDQSTGRAGREFPEEFRSGLDAYFNALEGAKSNEGPVVPEGGSLP